MTKTEENPPARAWHLPALVCGVTFLTYVTTLWFHFNYDDNPQILENPAVHSWRYFTSYFSGHVWSVTRPNVAGSFYRPLFLVWLRLNYGLFGAHAMGWHLTTIGVHVAATYMVYLLAQRLMREPAAAIAGLIFGVHPVHVEVATWISAVSDSLMTVFFIAAVLCFANSRERQKPAWMALSLLCYALALLTKEPAATLPFVIVAYACFYPEDSSPRWRTGLQDAAPYVAITVAYIVARATALRGFSHPVTPLSTGQVFLTFPSLLWFYLRMLLFPFRLSLDYDLAYVSAAGFHSFVLPLIVVLLAAGLLFFWAKRSRDAAVGFASIWLVAALLPVFDLRVLEQGDFVHDRYLYLPSVGFAILLAAAIAQLSQVKPGYPALRFAAAAVVVGALALGATRQEVYWANDLALFQQAVAVAPQNDVACNNLGGILLMNGRYQEAVPLYLAILQRTPQDWLANRSLGLTYYRLGEWSQAQSLLARATDLRQDDPTSFAYFGAAEMQLGNFAQAEKHLRQALGLFPQGMGYHYFLGMVLEKEGLPEAAKAEYRAELANHGQHEGARLRLAQMQAAGG